MTRRLGAEFFGTFWLTFAGCGSAVLAAGFPALGLVIPYIIAQVAGAIVAAAVLYAIAAAWKFTARC